MEGPNQLLSKSQSIALRKRLHLRLKLTTHNSGCFLQSNVENETMTFDNESKLFKHDQQYTTSPPHLYWNTKIGAL